MNGEREPTEGAHGDRVDEAGADIGSEAADSADGTDASCVVRYGCTILALLLLAGAGVALALSHTDAAFVLGALGVCAWFLNLRGELKRKHRLKKTGRRNWESQ